MDKNTINPTSRILSRCPQEPIRRCETLLLTLLLATEIHTAGCLSFPQSEICIGWFVKDLKEPDTLGTNFVSGETAAQNGEFIGIVAML